MPIIRSIIITLVISAVIFTTACLAENASPKEGDFEKAVWLYKHENYEEALELFKKLRAGEPQSAIIAYYLGVTYKQMQDFKDARPHLEAALTLEPKAVNALPELIGLLYQSDKTEDAKRWLEVAEREGMNPAQITFFKGLVLLKEGKDPEGARALFEKARGLDESLTDTAKYFEALSYLQSNRLSSAKDIFESISQSQPNSDMAYFAGEYASAISKKEEAEKPLRGSFGYGVQYDTNVILAPDDPALSAGISDNADWRHVTTFDSEYRIKGGENFTIAPGYSFYWAKQFDLGFYDTISHDASLQSSIITKNAVYNFPVHFNHISINDKAYLGLVSVGNVDNFIVGRNQMFQVAVQYSRKDYLWPVSFANDNRDSNEGLAAVGWFYFFGKNKQGFANMRYAFNHDDTKGANWDYYGHRFSLSSSIPIAKKLQLSMALEYFVQDYWKTNSDFEKKRFDNTMSASSVLSFEVVKNLNLQLQYLFVDNDSTIGIYKYKRHIYTVGTKYNF